MFDQIKFSQRLIKYRKDMKISQTQLSEILGVTPQAVSRWETAESLPDLQVIGKLAEVFKIGIADFFNEVSKDANSIDKNEHPDVKYSSNSFKSANFSDMNLVGKNFSYSLIKLSKFDNAKLNNILFHGTSMASSSFNGSVLDDCEYKHSRMVNNHFINAALNNCDFWHNNMRLCIYTHCILTKGSWKGCNISAQYNDTKINKVNFSSSNFNRTIFNNTIIENCEISSCNFRKVTFTNCELKNTTFHASHCRGMIFVNCKIDQFTRNFLMSCKAKLADN